MPPRPSNPNEAVAFLAALSPSSMRLGLDRIRVALKALRSPERDYPALHVAGTNGKGSTCAMVASCLVQQGYRVGLYTSPHLVRVNERFKINGEDISDLVLGQRILEIIDAHPQVLESPPPLTYFEVGTLVALWHFSREEVDVAVLETGLGGRLDATNAAVSSVTAITPISLDHQEHLGHTLRAIAGEKAGILKAGVPAAVSRQPPEVLEVLERAAREVGAPLRLEGRDFDLEPERGDSFSYRGMRTRVSGLRLGLRGDHQRQNAAVALACLELLEDRGLPISADNARAGLLHTRWPARLESLDELPLTVVDGAHNPAGVEALCAALEVVYPGREVHLVFGVLAEKDHRAMVRRLFPRCASVHLTPLASPRSLAPERYLDEVRPLCREVMAHGSVADALGEARRRAGSQGLALCAGSLVLAGQVKALLGE